ncbi:MAG: hypothetical protein K2P78_13845, partial [Gemmataceae bacterium]|nr:hypothetical protein [Gemmataceae bacterium]
PFGELLDAPPGDWRPVEKAAKLFGLFVPLGLLGARLPGRFWGEAGLPRVVALALAAAAGLEAIQLPVESRMPSATDVVVGAAGATAGWLIGRNRRLVPLAGLGWLAILALAWGPLPPVGRDPPAAFDWVPGLSLESGDPLFALEDVLTKLILFGLGGAVVGAMGVDVSGRLRATIGAVTGLLVSGVIEATQMGYGAHTPAVTDVLLGGLGAALGANIVGRPNRK